MKSRKNPFREWHCIYCVEKFIHPPLEDWVQRNACEEWCDENCTDGVVKETIYLRLMCQVVSVVLIANELYFSKLIPKTWDEPDVFQFFVYCLQKKDF